jgi:hypothetical protein
VQLSYRSQTAHDVRPMSPLANRTSGIAILPCARIRLMMLSIMVMAIAL